MKTLDELYQQMLKRAAEGKPVGVDGDPKLIDCLAHPDDHPLIWRVKPCLCPPDEPHHCQEACDWGAITSGPDGIAIDDSQCVGCQACVDACKLDTLKTRKDLIPVVQELHDYDGPIYAMVAPAVSGQFGPDITMGKLRTAFKRLGFTGMLEVAVFADILTLKEALEFDKNINSEDQFQLTSCCCPMWIAMIKKLYHQLLPNVPGSVSPMIAGGRTVKALHPKAKTVFIGPCLAKKAERKEPDLVGAVDYVLTYQELRDLFSVTNIDLASLPEDNLPHASEAGISYAYARFRSRHGNGPSAESGPPSRHQDPQSRWRPGLQSHDQRHPGRQPRRQLLRRHGLHGRLRRWSSGYHQERRRQSQCPGLWETSGLQDADGKSVCHRTLEKIRLPDGRRIPRTEPPVRS